MEGSKVPASRRSLRTHDSQSREMMGVAVGCEWGSIKTEVEAEVLQEGRKEWLACTKELGRSPWSLSPYWVPGNTLGTFCTFFHLVLQTILQRSCCYFQISKWQKETQRGHTGLFNTKACVIFNWRYHLLVDRIYFFQTHQVGADFEIWKSSNTPSWWVPSFGNEPKPDLFPFSLTCLPSWSVKWVFVLSLCVALILFSVKPQSLIGCVLFLFLIKNFIYLFILRKTKKAQAGEGQREEEKENPKHAPQSVRRTRCEAQTYETVRSWPGLKSRVECLTNWVTQASHLLCFKKNPMGYLGGSIS